MYSPYAINNWNYSCTFPFSLLAADQRPTLAELQTFSVNGEYVHIMADVADKWEHICVALNLDPEGRMLKKIERQFPNRPEDCCREMFQKWLKTKVLPGSH